MTAKVKIEHKIANQIRKLRNIEIGKTHDDEFVRRYYAHLPKPSNGKYTELVKH